MYPHHHEAIDILANTLKQDSDVRALIIGYLYHKWLLKVLASAPHKPDGLLEVMDECLSTRAPEPVQRYRDMIENFTTWPPPDANWPNTFMLDSERNWLDREPPITDL